MLQMGQIVSNTYKMLSIEKSTNNYILYTAENLKTSSKCNVRQIYSNDFEFYKQSYDTLRNVSHDNLQKVLDFFITEECIFLVQEHIDGKYIRDVLQEKADDHESLSMNLIIKWALELAMAMEHLYNLNIPQVDYNINMENMLIDSENNLHVVDLDLQFDVTTERETSMQKNIQHIGEVLNTIINSGVEVKGNLNVAKEILEKFHNGTYKDYQSIISDLNTCILQLRKNNNRALVSTAVIMVVFFAVALYLIAKSFSTNLMLLVFAVVFILIDIILALTLDTSLLHYKNIEKKTTNNSKQFDIVKSITIINTDDTI
jgi:hypothetical protein